jgi:hypothetical protein
MTGRCKHPTFKNWKNYGGRGITVCERWAGPEGFACFIEDMGRRPSPKHSLDRIDNNGNYTPLNCRWATAKQQGNNRRTNRLLTLDGKTKSITEWADERGVGRYLIWHRLQRGWSVRNAITTPPRLRVHPDLTAGDLYGKWTVLGRAKNSPSGAHMYRCQCECGRECIVGKTQLENSLSTQCRSCGLREAWRTRKERA